MGEAKRRRQELVNLVTGQIALWDNPPSAAEDLAVEEIRLLPVRIVKRYPARLLAEMNMVPNECHVNALFMEINDPEGHCRKVTGYWVQGDSYVVHTVVERKGVLMCVTPTIVPTPDDFPFIPDPDIEWIQEGPHQSAFRKGHRLGIGLRANPEEQIRINRIMLERLAAGMHPMQAGTPPF